MFSIGKDRVVFALFEAQIRGFIPSFSRALLRHSKCICCGATISESCECNKKPPQEIYEDWQPLFYNALGNKKYSEGMKKGFSELIGVYRITPQIYVETIAPLYKKNLKENLYQPHSKKMRSARLSNSQENYTNEHIEWLKDAQGSECYYCGSSIKESCHVDHLCPLALGGDNGFLNIALSCPACNQSKHSKAENKFWLELKNRIPAATYKNRKLAALKLKELKIKKINKASS